MSDINSSSSEGFVESQGVHIHYLAKNIEAKKQRALVFVPGVMMPAWIWQNQLDYFSKNYTVIAIDPRSQGDSEQTTEGHYALSLAKDIKAVVDAFQLGPFVLIGWSLAVPEVVNYTIHFGTDKLKGLVLVDGLIGIDPSVPFYQSTINYWTELQVDRSGKTREFIKDIFKQPQSEAFLEKLYASAMRTPTNTVMTLIENYLLQDFRKLLPQIRIPTWLATIDGPRLDYMKDIHKLIPDCRLDIIKDAEHALFVDQPQEFNTLLEQWLNKVIIT